MSVGVIAPCIRQACGILKRQSRLRLALPRPRQRACCGEDRFGQAKRGGPAAGADRRLLAGNRLRGITAQRRTNHARTRRSTLIRAAQGGTRA
jgi:hypothetical protein